MTHNTPEGLPPLPARSLLAIWAFLNDLQLASIKLEDRQRIENRVFELMQIYAREALRAQAAGVVPVAFSPMWLAPLDGSPVMLYLPTTTDKFAVGVWHGNSWGDEEGNYYMHAPTAFCSLANLERLAAPDTAPPAHVPADVEAPDSYDAIWNALQAVNTAAVQLPTFAVKQDGGIEAFTQNIVDAINEASSILRTHPTPSPAQAVDERKEFEAWALKQPWIKDVQRYEGQDYGHYETSKAWKTWQASRQQQGVK